MDNDFLQKVKKIGTNNKIHNIKFIIFQRKKTLWYLNRALQKFLIVSNKKNQILSNDKLDKTTIPKNKSNLIESRKTTKSLHSSGMKFRINDSRNLNISRNISNEKNNERKDLNLINDEYINESTKKKSRIFDCVP